jgi:hypothetical protein
MAVYTVSFKQLLDGYAVLQTLVNAEIEVDRPITVAGVGAPFNGTFTVYALPQYEYVGLGSEGDPMYNIDVAVPNQVMFAVNADDVDRTAATGTITFTVTCTWITAAQIEDWLGIGTATAADTAFLTVCASAVNAMAFRRRYEAGYFDNATTSPSGDVTLGTIMWGGALYRARGSIDVFASFNEMGTAPTVGLSPMIKQLLGIDRPACAAS